VWRLEATISGKKGLTLTAQTEIGAGYLTAVNFPTSANGPAGLAYDSKHDILYVASEVDNEVFSIAGASKISSNPGVPGTVVYKDDAHLHGPTGLLLLSNGDLLTANDDGPSADPAQPSEIIEFTPGAPVGTFVTEFSADPTNGGAFGLALVKSGTQTQLGYVDDVATSVSVLSLFAR
jgi:hypothetical protein